LGLTVPSLGMHNLRRRFPPSQKNSGVPARVEGLFKISRSPLPQIAADDPVCTPTNQNEFSKEPNSMTRSRFTKPIGVIAALLAGLLFAILAVPLGAQPARQNHPYYDISKEVTLSGTVTDVVKKSSAGTILGAHLLFTTESGAVDASLGRWGLEGRGALSVAVGERVEVTGVMKTLKDREVFLARTVTVGGQAYTIRNEHGVLVSPQSREHASKKAAEKGGSL
jgi:hypothetical protein